MCVHVEVASDEAGALGEAGLKICEGLKKNIKNNVGVTTQIILHPPDELHRSEGKAQRFIDNRKRR